jgi:DNA-binding response OmpR family regulator
MKEVLSSAGYDVLEAPHGRDAVRMLQDTKVDLFITDLIRPEQEGIETVQILHRQYTQIKIIAMSGQFSNLLPAAQHLGADATLVKPFTPDELLHTVEAVMGNAGRDVGDRPTA